MERFPKDVKLREQWLLLLRMSDWNPKENSFVCETHFEQDQWTKARYHLKDGSVPTLFCTCWKNSCDHRGISSNEGDHTYSKHGFDCARVSLSTSIQKSDGKCITIMKSRPKLHEAHDSLLSKNQKKKCSKNSPCNRGHSNMCVMSNSNNNDQTGSLYSSEKERIFYELLEEHVALKSELGRLTRAYESTLKGD